MRQIRVKIPSDFIAKIGAPNFVPYINHLEILEFYQYDQQNFFSLQKMDLKPEYAKKLDDTMKNVFKTQFYSVIEQRGNEYLCIMKQRHDQGFWPKLLSGPWALIPPITVDSDSILITVVVNEQQNPELLEKVGQFTENMDIISMENVDNQPLVNRYGNGIPSSVFTSRQREIATYATRNGYYEMPKKISAEDIAKKFKCSVSNITEILRKVEKLLMKYTFG